MEVVLKAGPFSFPGDCLAAVADAEILVDEMDILSCLMCGVKRAEVPGAVRFDSSGQINPRIVIPAGDFQKRESLVVLEFDVEFWLVLLDKIVLEKGSFLFRIREQKVDVMRLVQKARDFGIGCGSQVGFHSLSQRSGFSDIDDAAVFVLEKIDARFSGDLFDLYLKLVCFINSHVCTA